MKLITRTIRSERLDEANEPLFRAGVTGIFFFFQAEDGIRDCHVTEVQTCALPILHQYVLTTPDRRGTQTIRRHRASGSGFITLNTHPFRPSAKPFLYADPVQHQSYRGKDSRMT